jgi:hypothetical protein
VAALDEACLFSPRGDFLASWTNQPGVCALAELQGGSLRGFGVLRPCREGNKTGPLFAKDPATANRIVRGLLAGAPEKNVYLDVPADNPAAMQMARELGLDQVFETARMYKNGTPELRSEWGIRDHQL